MIRQPLISVIVPCYNQGIFLNEALQSVSGQTYSHWECIIINDGSTDNAEKIALDWNNKDKRFKYFYKENGGLSSARNRGLDEAKGEYIQFLDADDLIAADKFAASLNSAGNADVIISDFKMFTNRNEAYISPSFILNKDQFNFHSILTGWDDQFVIPIHCGLFKTLVFNNIRFNESLKAREDWLMWLQIYLLNVETVFIAEPFALYRSSHNGMSQNRSLMDTQLVKAYQLIYEILPDEYRQIFFNKATNNLKRLLIESENLLTKTRQSKSYRLGNFFAKNFYKINKKNQVDFYFGRFQNIYCYSGKEWFCNS